MRAGKRFHQQCFIHISAMVLFLATCCQPLSAHAEEKQILEIQPYLPSTELYARFRPFAEYLASKTGIETELSISRTYREHIDRIGRDEVDIAFMGPFLFVLMVDRYGHKPLLAALEVNGAQKVRGVIIKRLDSKVLTLSALIGKRFAFGDYDSTFGHLVPRYMLWEAGVDVESLKTYEFLSDQENVALGVLMGIYDAGAVDTEVYEKYKDKGLAVLAFSPEIAGHVFVASSRLPQETVDALRNVLLALQTTDIGKAVLRAINKNVTSLVPVSEHDYDPLRKMLFRLREMGVEL